MNSRLYPRFACMFVVALLAAACGGANVNVVVEIPGGEGEGPVPVSDLEVQLLPYDRDAVFDSLAAEAAEAEPQFPADLLAARDEVVAAQQEWRDAELEWQTLRDTAQTISQAMEGLNRSERAYRELFQQFGDMERALAQAERRQEQAFQRFQSMQAETMAGIEAVNVMRDEWADEAFAAFDSVRVRLIDETGLAPAFDTTGAEGSVQFVVPPGRYWVHARQRRPYDEYYWNLEVTARRETPVELTLDADNAEMRPVY